MKKLHALKSLRVFESVARNKSFRRAADELFVSHSAVSQQIKLLEEELGVNLFDRSGRVTCLTLEGHRLYPVVNESFGNIDVIVDQLKSSCEYKTLNIQTYVSFGTKWLIPKLNKLQKKFPDFRVRVSISYSDVDFKNDDVDVGIIMGKQKWSHWSYNYLCDMAMFPVCSPELLKKHPLKTPQDLKKHTLLTVEEAPDEWRTWLKSVGIDEDWSSQGPVVDSHLQASERVFEGEGLFMSNALYSDQELKYGRLVKPFDMSIPESGSWFMVYPKEHTDNAQITLFKEWLTEEIKKDEHVIINNTAY